MTNLGEYRTYMTRKGFSARTIAQREAFARARLADWGDLDQPPERIADFLTAYAGHTKRTYYDHAVAMYRWLVESGQLDASPMSGVRRPPTPKPRPRPLTRDDATRVLLHAEGDLRAYLLLGRFAGLRAHEIAKFRGEDIDPDWLYVFGKGAQGQVLPTHPALWDLAGTYPRQGFWFPSERSASGHVTPHAVTMRVSRHFARLGSSHRNRHLFGTELLRNGANIRTVQALMRHADMATTVRYLGVDEADKLNAIRSLTG
jgi:integrase